MARVVESIEGRLANLRKLPVFLSHVEIRSSDAFGTHLILCTVPRATRHQAHSLLALFEDVPSVVGCVLTSSSGRTSQSRHARRVVRGEPHLFERFQDMVFRISDRSFMQANWPVYSSIFETLADWVNGEVRQVRVLELYAGVGCIGLGLAKNGALVTEIEENPYAVADAKQSASHNHVGRYRVRAAKVEGFLETVATDEYDVIVVDPPRSGLSRQCIESLERIRVPRMLYLSCDASLWLETSTGCVRLTIASSECSHLTCSRRPRRSKPWWNSFVRSLGARTLPHPHSLFGNAPTYPSTSLRAGKGEGKDGHAAFYPSFVRKGEGEIEMFGRPQ